MQWPHFTNGTTGPGVTANHWLQLDQLTAVGGRPCAARPSARGVARCGYGSPSQPLQLGEQISTLDMG